MKLLARRGLWFWLGAAWVILVAAGPCAAQLISSDDPAAPYDPAPQRLVWPGVAVIVVVAIFITAALAGSLIRANIDQPSDTGPSAPENPE